jgi:hypothetical protein
MRREENPVFAAIPPQQHKLSVRFLSHPSLLLEFIRFIFILFFIEKSTRNHQSFELSTIDHHNSNLKPNTNDSDIYGVNIQVHEEVQ